VTSRVLNIWRSSVEGVVSNAAWRGAQQQAEKHGHGRNYWLVPSPAQRQRSRPAYALISCVTSSLQRWTFL